MTTHNGALTGLTETATMGSARRQAALGYRRAALGGAVICALLALGYTVLFILYALGRSLFTVTATVNQDAGMLGTLIATWASLFVAAFVIGMLLTVAVAILGAFTGIIVNAVSAVFNPQREPKRAVAIGTGVCFALIVLLHLALRSAMNYSLPDLLSMHALFWLGIPSMIFIVAGGLATRRA